jgi:hypothetical protein
MVCINKYMRWIVAFLNDYYFKHMGAQFANLQEIMSYIDETNSGVNDTHIFCRYHVELDPQHHNMIAKQNTSTQW